jgi:hypothetical protein
LALQNGGGLDNRGVITCEEVFIDFGGDTKYLEQVLKTNTSHEVNISLGKPLYWSA